MSSSLVENEGLTINLRNKIQVNEKEAAVLLSISPQTLAKWRKSGEGPPCFHKGVIWFYPVRALEDWSVIQVNLAS